MVTLGCWGVGVLPCVAPAVGQKQLLCLVLCLSVTAAVHEAEERSDTVRSGLHSWTTAAAHALRVRLHEVEKMPLSVSDMQGCNRCFLNEAAAVMLMRQGGFWGGGLAALIAAKMLV